jgi:peroxiredoxin
MLDVTTLRRVATTAGLVLAACLACTQARASPVGEAAPAFRAPGLDGQVVDLDAWRGHPVLVSFWATWCAPCRKELPMFETLYRRYRAQGLEVVAISLDEAGARDDVRKIVSGLTFPVVLGRDATLNGFPAPDALPLTLVVDAHGVIRARFPPRRSGLTETDVSEALLPLLNAPAAAASH